MKKIFLILAMLTSTVAFAKSSKPKSNSDDLSDYILLTKSDTGFPGTTFGGFSPVFVQDMKFQCFQMLSNKMAIDEIPETECSDVVLKNTILKSCEFIRIPQRYDCYTQILTETYCKPRSYSDAALMSLFKKCKESPQKECLTPQIIAQFNQVKRTTVTERNTGDCTYNEQEF